jgi:hypothetical protein
MLYVHRLVKCLFDNFDESNLTGFDYQIIYHFQSWLANETKEFDDNQAWDNPVSL